jgi:proton-dependent oligopeptide transporter, POT family
MAERLGWRPTTLRRMTAGMFLGRLSFLISGLVQAQMDHGQSLSILWQLAPYVVLEAGEVLLSATQPGIRVLASAGPAQERGDEHVPADHRRRPFSGRGYSPN